MRLMLERAICMTFSLILFVGLFSSCDRPVGNNPYEVVRYASFRDIPGVTEGEITAIEALQEEIDYFVYGMPESVEAFLGKDGKIRGYAALFCEWLQVLFDIPFQLELYEWEDLLEGMESGEIDFSGEITRTEERQNVYFMTDAIAQRIFRYYRLEGSEAISEIEKSRPLRYAFLEGSITHDVVSPFIKESFEAFNVEFYETAYRMLESGEIDAFFDTNTTEAIFDVFGGVVGEDFIPPIYVSVSLSTRNPELEPIISVVQKALQGDALYFLARLYNQGHQEYRKHKLFLQFDEEELAYLQNNRVVSFVAEFDNYPASFYNVHERQWQGIVFDVLGEVETLTGLSFELVNEKNAEWPVILGMLEDGEASMISELVRTQEREGRFLWPQTAFFENNPALISKSDFPSINIYEILHVKVALPKGTVYAELFKTWFPDHTNIIEYESIDLSIDAMQRGEVDMVMLSTSGLLVLTNYLELPGYKANLIFSDSFYSMFGFNVNEVVLTSIVDKALEMIDMEDISYQWKSRTFDYRIMLAQAQIPWLIGATALSLGLLFLFVLWYRKRNEGRQLESVVQERTAELNVTLTELETSGRAKSVFLANMSHEMRTPLNAIIGMSSIGEDAPDIKRKNYCLSRIKDASTHLLGMINDILDMSKIEANKLELSPTEFSLEKMIQRVVSIVSFHIEEKQQKLTVSIDQDIPKMLIADEQRLAQVLTNLLGNAIKFTLEEGSIRLGVRFLAYVDTQETKDICTIQFEVADTGIGMSAEQQAHIFESFRQAGTDTTRKFGGTGLGLSISKSIVEMMNGEIWVESEQGRGSTFSFTIQAIPGKEKEASEEFPSEAISQFQGHCILLVEDVEINQEIVLALLEPALVTIDCAENGAEAVRMFGEAPEKYDLIFMDLQMPEMDGYEATEHIRALNHPEAKSIPIIAMSANMFKEDVEKCYEVGMDGHIGKPLDFEKVLDELRRYLKPS